MLHFNYYIDGIDDDVDDMRNEYLVELNLWLRLNTI